MSYKADNMGTYNDEEIPAGAQFPLKVDAENLAITFADNIVLGRYAGQTIEESVLILEKRKAEFVVKLANGDIIVRKDTAGNQHVFRIVDKKLLPNGRIQMEYEKVKVPASV